MFNIHSTEILLVLIVALIVIGPERLPAAIRTASLWVGRFRRSFYKVKAEIEREINADEIRRQIHNESVLAELEEAKQDIEGSARDAEQSVNKIVSSDTLDPGRSKHDSEDESQEQSPESNEKSIRQELTEAGEQIEEIKREVYALGKNPKLGGKSGSDDNSSSGDTT